MLRNSGAGVAPSAAENASAVRLAVLSGASFEHIQLTGGNSLVKLGIAATTIKIYQLVVATDIGCSYQLGYSDNDETNFVALGGALTNLTAGQSLTIGALGPEASLTIPTAKAFAIASEGTVDVYLWSKQD